MNQYASERNAREKVELMRHVLKIGELRLVYETTHSIQSNEAIALPKPHKE